MRNWMPALLPLIMLIALLLFLLLSGCAGTSVILKDVTEKGTSERVRVFISHSVPGYDGLVQEIRADNGLILVERFSNRSIDEHTTSRSNHFREMTIYPANVEGMDLSPLGFGHLPQNRDGTAITNAPDSFNKWYQDEYETRGRVVGDAKEYAVKWTIRWENGKAHVKIYESDGDLVFVFPEEAEK